MRETVNAEGRTVSAVGKVFGNVSLIIITQMNLGCVDTFLISFAFTLLLLSFFFFLSLSRSVLNSIIGSFLAMSVNEYVWKDAE